MTQDFAEPVFRPGPKNASYSDPAKPFLRKTCTQRFAGSPCVPPPGKQPDGSTAVTADSHKVGTLSDLLDDYDFTSPSEADSPTAADGLTFSGTTELRAAPATPPTSAAVFMVVVTTDAQAVLLNDRTDGRYSGVIESGSGSPAHSEGAADNYVDGSATSITTRGALYTALADGEPHIVERRGIPLTTWANLEIGGFAGGGGLYRLNGVAIPVCVLDDDDEDIATARALALQRGEPVRHGANAVAEGEMMGTEIRTLRILADRGGEEPPRFAAQELARYLERMCRVCVPVEEVEFPISADYMSQVPCWSHSQCILLRILRAMIQAVIFSRVWECFW